MNKLTLIQDLGFNKGIYACICGNSKELYKSNVKNGLSKDCGCTYKIGKKYNLIGKIFKRLTVLNEYKIGPKRYCDCLCNCGKNKNKIYNRHLLNGSVGSCGCIKKEKPPTNFLHGNTVGSRTRIYRIRAGIKGRCYTKSNSGYKTYGNVGIGMSDKRIKFQGFLHDMFDSYVDHCKIYGEKNTTIDRIDNYGNYEKDNCRRATYKVQSNNRRNIKK